MSSKIRRGKGIEVFVWAVETPWFESFKALDVSLLENIGPKLDESTCKMVQANEQPAASAISLIFQPCSKRTHTHISKCLIGQNPSSEVPNVNFNWNMVIVKWRAIEMNVIAALNILNAWFSSGAAAQTHQIVREGYSIGWFLFRLRLCVL